MGGAPATAPSLALLPLVLGMVGGGGLGGVPLGGGKMLDMGGNPPQQLVWVPEVEAGLLVLGVVWVRGVLAEEEGGHRGLVGGEGLLLRTFLSLRLMAKVSSESISGFRLPTMSSTRDRILTDLVWGEGSLDRRTSRRGGLLGRGGGGDLGVSSLDLPLGVLVITGPCTSLLSSKSGTDKEKNNTFYIPLPEKNKFL